MTTWYRKQGDSNDTILMRLNGIQDLQAATAQEAHVWQADDDTATVLTATVVDPIAKTVRVNLANWIDTALGEYHLETQLIISGSPKTWPEKGTDTIVISAAR